MADNFTLVIGNKNLSSWSLRPWLVLKQCNVPFTETLIRLDEPETRAKIKDVSPSGLVPCLLHNGFAVWDSLAICEYIAETVPTAGLWPEEAQARARARSLAAQMHSGFASLRNTWPMEFTKEGLKVNQGPGVKQDVERIMALWDEARAEFGEKAEGQGAGAYLFGRFSIADAMFAPVVSRFTTYGPFDMPERVAAYMNAVWTMPAMKEWGDGARKEVVANTAQ